jgi:peptidoglycan/xylan/chitin deacetylase (PgdA/CDA1 family)
MKMKSIITTSWDDGHSLDLKLAELLAKYDIPATFYIPISCPSINHVEGKRIDSPDIRNLASQFDIGGHTYNHVKLAEIPAEQAKWEIEHGKKELEDITGKPVTTFAYPYNSFNSRAVSLVSEAGFKGARTTDYFSRQLDNPFKMKTTGTASNSSQLRRKAFYSLNSFDFQLWKYFFRKNLLFKSWKEAALDMLDFVANNGGIWHLWGHSWELEKNNDWANLEEIFKQIKMTKNLIKIDNSELINNYYKLN